MVEPPSNVPYEMSVCDDRSSAEFIGVIIPVSEKRKKNYVIFILNLDNV